MSILLNLALRKIDFVLACTEAPVKTDLYMELTQGIQTKYSNSNDCELKLLSNLFSQKQAGQIWNQYLVEKLIGFKQSIIERFEFYCNDAIYIV